MAKIRHLAIKTKSPQRLAKFYEQVFDMKVILTEKSGAIYMSDGYLTLAILKNRGDYTPSGINHFGFQVDDIEDMENSARRKRRSNRRPHKGFRARRYC